GLGKNGRGNLLARQICSTFCRWRGDASPVECRRRFSRPRQRQPRREAGTQSYGLLTARGGADKAARLPKGWTGPVSMSGRPGFRKEARIFFAPLAAWRLRERTNAKPQAATRPHFTRLNDCSSLSFSSFVTNSSLVNLTILVVSVFALPPCSKLICIVFSSVSLYLPSSLMSF